jgi:hypothetical protein
MSFTVVSEPVRLRYGEVHNKMQVGSGKGLPIPPDVVARYAKGDALMGISGFDPEMVRKHSDGSETRVKLSDHYLHHYILYFGQAHAMRELIDLAAGNEHSAHKITGCHGMTGAGMRAFHEHVAAEGKHLNDNLVSFGSAAGAEYRHNPQRFEAPYRLVVRRPATWAPTMHIINTNLADNTTMDDAPAVSPLLECPCTPQRNIDPVAGTIDGKAADPPIHCGREFDATGNPSCHLSTYRGGWRCCEHGMFLVDTDKACKTPNCTEKVVDEVFMKFTFYYEDVNASTKELENAACCDVTGSGQGDTNIEHDVVPCAEGTPPEQCVFVAESVQPLAYFGSLPGSRPWGSDLVDLVFAAPHLHWAGNSIELFDHETNETLCEVHRTPDNSGGVMYGTGDEPGNERGYLTGLTPCSWGGGRARRFRRDHKLRTRAVYNATTYHTGVMSLWLINVAAAVDGSADVLV